MGSAPPLTQAEVEAVRRPIDRARTFPRRAFTSPDFFSFEQERIVERNWLAVCFADEITNPGDTVPIDVWGLPLFVARGFDGRIRAFHNVCDYDGCPVVTARLQGAPHLRVAYHGWRYDLEGRLIDAPYWAGPPGNGLDAVPAQHRALKRLPCGVSLGVVFVNTGSRPSDFSDHIGGLEELLAEFDLDDLGTAPDESGEVDVFESALATNWKTFADNDCLNILHESFTHAMYAASPEIPRVGPDGTPKFEVVSASNVFGFSYAESDVMDTYPPIDLPHIGRERRPERGFFLQIYPNLSVAVMDTLIAPVIQFPEAPGRTRLRGATLVRKQAATPDHASRRRVADELFAEAAEEDAAVMEAIQRSRRSPARDQGFYAPFWDEPQYLFANRILDDLLDDRTV